MPRENMKKIKKTFKKRLTNQGESDMIYQS